MIKEWSFWRRDWKNKAEKVYNKTLCLVVGQGNKWEGAHFNSQEKAQRYLESQSKGTLNEHTVKEEHQKN